MDRALGRWGYARDLHPQRLTVKSRDIGFKGAALYGLGDLAGNIYWQSVTMFLLFYYTDVMGLHPATAGLIYLAASVWDGLIDPLIGVAADRTRTRWGGYRPYLMFGGPLLALSFGLLYYRPPLEGAGLVTFVLVSHLVFRTCYAMVNIPYGALSARITHDPERRSQLSGFRMFFGTVAAVLVSLFTQPLAHLLNASGNGYFYAALCFGALASVLFPIVFAGTRELPTRTATAPAPAIAALIGSVVHNRAFWMLNIGAVCFAISGTVLTKSVLYYFKYALNDEKAGPMALAATGLAGLVMIPLWTILARHIGKRRVWIAGCVVGILALSFFSLTTVTSALTMTAILVAIHCGLLALFFAFWAILPDTVDYGEWKTQVRADAFLFGMAGMFSKISIGVGAGLFGLGLGLTHYHPNVPQTAATLAGMKTLMVSVPMIGFIGCLIVALLSPLTSDTYQKMAQSRLERP